MEGQIILNGLSTDQLLQLLEKAVETKVEEVVRKVKAEELQEKFLSPEEICNLFKPAITKPTLESYSKKYFKKYYLGGRTWYKYAEVIGAMKEIKKYSR